MANKKLGTAASELRLPTKKDKSAKKPKWQAKTGGTKAKEQGSEVQETVEQEVTFTPPEPTEAPVVATNLLDTAAVPTTVDEAVTTHDIATPAEPAAPEESSTEMPAISDEPTSKKPRKLKVQADAPPKKLSMIAAALQVLQDRKVAMTCPELIDCLAPQAYENETIGPGRSLLNTIYFHPSS